MKAMILAAGRGTRLRPLTESVPKALVKVNGRPLLEILIRKLRAFGFDEIIINIHHLGEKILAFLDSNPFPGVRIAVSDEREQLLDTGGALLKAAPLIGDGEPCLVHNVDVLSGIDLGLLMDYHVRVKNLVTLCVRQRVSNRYFLFDSEKRLTGWKNTVTGEERFVTNAPSGGEALAFSGIHVIGPGFFEQALAAKCFPISNPVFPVVDVYLCLAACGGVMGYEHTTDHWIDIGTVRNLENIPEVLTNLINRY